MVTSPITIMVVEHEAPIRRALRLVLETAGYAVIEAADAHNAMLLALHHMPDLVLQDLMLPDSTAFLFARELRALPQGDCVPIIALCQLESHLADARSNDIGYAAFLRLPVSDRALVESVKQAVPEPEPELHKPGDGLRVLVLDDNTMQRQLLALYLREWGFEPLPVETLDEALRTARHMQVDAVVCDVLMPKHDGFSCCRQMRAEPSLADRPIVLVSAATPEDDDWHAARAAGASAILMGVPGFWGLREALRRTLSGLPPVLA
ncbi:MAG TPA: response regulator [Polyangiales bacterium]|nr:response regulator [Polyangiales bacterium]